MNDPGILVTQSVHKQQAGFLRLHKFIKTARIKEATALCTAQTHEQLIV